MLYVDSSDYYINIVHKDSEELLSQLEKYKGNKVALFSDEKVYHIYKNHLNKLLGNYNIYPYIFPVGEKTKSLEYYAKAMEFLSDNDFSRSDLVLAFGGGVVGDISAFIASTYQRGLDYISVPTSLLAMVDSSIGGKTAINLKGHKNQIGSFYFPSYVHIDYSYLDSLDERNIKSAMAEVFKYAVLNDSEMFDRLLQSDEIDFEWLISKSLEMKFHYVEGDENDQDKRQYLNLGHSIGHGIEKLSKNKVLHGEAVGIGIIQMAKLSYKLGLAQDDLSHEIEKAFHKYGMVTSYDYRIGDMVEAIRHDKKIRSDKINMIFPTSIGSATNREIALDELEKLLKLL